MIFVTTGTQLPFPRLIRAMDGLAATEGAERIVAQIGPDPGPYPHLESHAQLGPEAFDQHFRAARLVVAHAGIGTVLTAKRLGKPLVLLPRRHGLGEHRNDHQLATAKGLEGQDGLYVAWQAEDLAALLARSDLQPMSDAPGPNLAPLCTEIAAFIAG